MHLFVIPAGLGLLGFVEPCSIGSSLVFIKYVEGRSTAAKLGEVTVFALTRAAFIGLLGILAALIGATFLAFQKAGWIVLGTAYAAIGALYVARRIEPLMIAIGPRLGSVGGRGGAAALGVLFGLNIPACAAPLLFVLLGAAAAGGARTGAISGGFVALAIFGLALSLPLVMAVYFAPARAVLDRLAGLSRRVPFWTGALLIALGLWSIGFALFAEIKA